MESEIMDINKENAAAAAAAKDASAMSRLDKYKLTKIYII